LTINGYSSVSTISGYSVASTISEYSAASTMRATYRCHPERSEGPVFLWDRKMKAGPSLRSG